MPSLLQMVALAVELAYERTSPYAERSALWHAISAAHAAEVDDALLIDSQTVACRFARFCNGDCAGDAVAFAFGIKSFLAGGTVQPSVGCHPTTNRQTDWQPHRRANAWADRAATGYRTAGASVIACTEPIPGMQ